MANGISDELARLIRQRSHASGKIPKLEKLISERESAVKAARERLRSAREQLEATRHRVAELDAEITKLAPGIDPDEIRTQRRPG